MRIFKSFCENNSGKERILQEYTEKGSLFGEPSFLSLLSFDFYLCRFRLLSFYLLIFIFVSNPSIFVVFCFPSYTFRKCSSSFSLGMSAVSW